ncbi:hypothetical protein JCM30471_36380 [Desulfuromonas carbonis]|uniref:hypothetical protein n=1 Tax=Desulfuromonas sp. DDH964 TaxID=1823759 RepID=UPI00078B42E4|nr:hypothetical protein [Desulfuromonas sp. DDH964]AMV72994.1 hypothetical protein DBW_2670 [Desulfuromonas sp. DDH964]
MTRFLLSCLLIFLLAACAQPPAPAATAIVEPQRELFFQGLDELLATGTSPALQRLVQENGASPWKGPAQSLLDWQAAAAAELQRKTAEQQQKIKQCIDSNEKLVRENETLNRDLQELKRIMVEMEKRAL